MSAKQVVVTGSRGLLGRSVVGYLRLKNYDVVELDLTLGHDLTDEAFVRSWFAAHEAHGLVNMFALNDHVDASFAGTSLLDVSLSSFQRYMDVNVTALFSVCREFIRHNTTGSIVNASSIYGRVSPRPSLYAGSEKHPGYGVSKAAVILLSQHLAVHAAPNFKVNCLLLGGVENGQPEEFIARYSSQVPLGRMAEPSDIPPVVEFLLSDASKYVTGALFPVDGGWTS